MAAPRLFALAFGLLVTALAFVPGAQAGIVDTACEPLGGCSYPLIPCTVSGQVFCGWGGQTCLIFLVADPGPPDPPAYYCV